MSDAEKWGMAILSVLLIAGLLAFYSQSPEQSKTSIALAPGYISAFALAMNNQGDDITKIRAEINTRIQQSGTEDVSYPVKPGDGESSVRFANTVIGILSAKSEAETCAFQLGFSGLMDTNTPGTYPGFSIRKTARCAGFPNMSHHYEEKYFLDLMESARR
ncbi:MAG: hypothetical protein ABJL55_19730 [Roseibium sp.]